MSGPIRSRAAEVRLNGQRVGYLEVTDHHCVFTYDAEWLRRPDARPLSVSLPLRPDPYPSNGLHAFFAGLLPEGFGRRAATSRLGLAYDDDIGLLWAIGGDCIGAVEVVPVRSSR